MITSFPALYCSEPNAIASSEPLICRSPESEISNFTAVSNSELRQCIEKAPAQLFSSLWRSNSSVEVGIVPGKKPDKGGSGGSECPPAAPANPDCGKTSCSSACTDTDSRQGFTACQGETLNSYHCCEVSTCNGCADTY